MCAYSKTKTFLLAMVLLVDRHVRRGVKEANNLDLKIQEVSCFWSMSEL